MFLNFSIFFRKRFYFPASSYIGGMAKVEDKCHSQNCQYKCDRQINDRQICTGYFQPASCNIYGYYGAWSAKEYPKRPAQKQCQHDRGEYQHAKKRVRFRWKGKQIQASALLHILRPFQDVNAIRPTIFSARSSAFLGFMPPRIASFFINFLAFSN